MSLEILIASSDRETSEGDFNKDRITKKVRFKEMTEDAIENMVVDLSYKAVVSWKDKLLGEYWMCYLDFNPLKPFPNMVLAWIHFSGMPGFLYKRQVLEEISSLIGKVPHLDVKTDSGARGQFPMMAIFIDLEKPIVS
ncbi:hypothetical protein PVK06_041338 [Gossypium arboreum]|uniref:DUF4283 domain-containing protein n=1 Tax=Gossypium arboreum TaxID=29729 RepID=A0ABR0N7X1_GOSAR|nr:hypothetical protein PVK06_041338 [Gossypium arboreum]